MKNFVVRVGREFEVTTPKKTNGSQTIVFKQESSSGPLAIGVAVALVSVCILCAYGLCTGDYVYLREAAKIALAVLTKIASIGDFT